MTQQRLAFHIGVNGPSDNKYRAYAEVFGFTLDDAAAHSSNSSSSSSSLPSLSPVAWMSAIVNVESSLSLSLSSPLEYFIPLELDLDWVSLARVRGPFVLRNVALQNADSGVEVCFLCFCFSFFFFSEGILALGEICLLTVSFQR
jgi:hypothetical protein